MSIIDHRLAVQSRKAQLASFYAREQPPKMESLSKRDLPRFLESLIPPATNKDEVYIAAREEIIADAMGMQPAINNNRQVYRLLEDIAEIARTRVHALEVAASLTPGGSAPVIAQALDGNSLQDLIINLAQPVALTPDAFIPEDISPSTDNPQNNSILEQPFWIIGISPRVKHSIERHNCGKHSGWYVTGQQHPVGIIKTVDDLRRYTARQLRELCEFGPKAVQEVEKGLARFGLFLPEDKP